MFKIILQESPELSESNDLINHQANISEDNPFLFSTFNKLNVANQDDYNSRLNKYIKSFGIEGKTADQLNLEKIEKALIIQKEYRKYLLRKSLRSIKYPHNSPELIKIYSNSLNGNLLEVYCLDAIDNQKIEFFIIKLNNSSEMKITSLDLYGKQFVSKDYVLGNVNIIEKKFIPEKSNKLTEESKEPELDEGYKFETSKSSDDYYQDFNDSGSKSSTKKEKVSVEYQDFENSELNFPDNKNEDIKNSDPNEEIIDSLKEYEDYKF